MSRPCEGDLLDNCYPLTKLVSFLLLTKVFLYKILKMLVFKDLFHLTSTVLKFALYLVSTLQR